MPAVKALVFLLIISFYPSHKIDKFEVTSFFSINVRSLFPSEKTAGKPRVPHGFWYSVQYKQSISKYFHRIIDDFSFRSAGKKMHTKIPRTLRTSFTATARNPQTIFMNNYIPHFTPCQQFNGFSFLQN